MFKLHIYLLTVILKKIYVLNYLRTNKEKTDFSHHSHLELLDFRSFPFLNIDYDTSFNVILLTVKREIKAKKCCVQIIDYYLMSH